MKARRESQMNLSHCHGSHIWRLESLRVAGIKKWRGLSAQIFSALSGGA